MENRYESILPRLAASAQRHPRWYRARVVALAMLGYGMLVGLLVLLVAAAAFVVFMGFQAGGAAAWKLAIPLLVLIGILLEALWIQIDPPKGLVLDRKEAPALWAEIERIRKAMKAPAPHQVLISNELNASIQQVPRLGILGFYRTYLTIGLPLAAALTPDELRAVLAHEYGHIAGAHGRFGVWIYRVRATWMQVLDSLEERRHPALALFRAFLRWYAPFFDAYTAVLRRAHEFEADRDAARVAGAEAAAAGLCRLNVAARFMDEAYWPGVLTEVPERSRAPEDTVRRLLHQAPGAALHPDAAAWLAEEAALATEPWDSHPSLADRLAALGSAPVVPAGPARPSGAEAFFGEAAPRLADRLGRRWADAMQLSWGEKHEQHLRMTRRLADIEARAGEQPLPPEQARERIILTFQLRGATVAVPLMRDFLDAGQDDPSVHFLLGQALVLEDDEAGLRHLERAMELDPDTTFAACDVATGFLHARGRGGDADAFRRRAAERAEILERARAERDARTLSHRDTFLPHGLETAHAQALSTQLSMVRGLKRALLARKAVTVMPETPCFVLAVEPVWKPGELEGNNPSDQLAERVLKSVSLPGTLLVIEFVENGWALEKTLQQVPGAELFRRAAPARAGAR
jgi:Zn-dependent protease with chaperone function